MTVVSIDLLRAGMRLAGDVVDRNGRRLLCAGDVLDDQRLRVLKIWGVTQATVEGEQAQAVESDIHGEIPVDILAGAEAYTRGRLSSDSDHPAVHELVRVCTRRLARKMLDDPQYPAHSDTWWNSSHSASPTAEVPKPVSVHDLLRDDMRMGTLPSVFHRLVEVVNDPRSSATDVAEVISNDVDLSARLLRLVNSPFYGLRSRIDTISRAVTIIGSNQLVSLAMGVSIITAFRGLPEEHISLRSFWEHSIACGTAARILASYHKTPNTERFFVAGLLHDIGRLAIYTLLPAHASYLVARVREERVTMHSLEKSVLGFTHDRLAGLLLKEWKCPVSLEKNVRYHHVPSMAPNTLEAAVLNIADVFANAFEFGTSGEHLIPVPDDSVWDTLDFPVSVIGQTAIQMDYQVSEIVRLMCVDE